MKKPQFLSKIFKKQSNLESVKAAKSDLIYLLSLRIREALPDMRPLSNDKEVALVSAHALILLEEEKEKSAGFMSKYIANQKSVNEIVRNVINNEQVNRVMKDYWLVSHYLESRFPWGKAELASSYMEKIKSLSPNAVSLNFKSFKAMRKKAKKEIKKVKLILENRSDIKFSFSFRSIGIFMVSAYPIIFIFSYLYNRILLMSIDINISNFFSVEDYISSSIEKIAAAIISTVISFVANIQVNLKEYVSLKRTTHQVGRKHNWNYWRFMRLALWAFIFIAAIIVGNIKDIFELEIVGKIMLGLLFAMVAFRYLSEKYLKNTAQVFLFFSALSLFAIYLTYDLMQQRHNLKYGDLADIKKYEFEFSDAVSYSQENMVLVVSGKDFFIFRDMKSQTSIAVPREHIISVKSIKN